MTLVISYLFDDSHSDRYEGISQCCDLPFSWWLVMSKIFSCACWALYVFFGKMPKSTVPFLIRLFEGYWFFFFMLSYRHSLYILDINALSDISFLNIFSHSAGCIFVLFLCCAKAFKFWIVLHTSNLLDYFTVWVDRSFNLHLRGLLNAANFR